MRPPGLLALSVLVVSACSSDPSPQPVSTTAPTEPPELVYRQHVIAFDDAAQGTTITDQYQRYAKFSSSPGLSLQTKGAPQIIYSQPNFLGASDDHAPIFVDFELPVAEIGFTLVGVNNTGKVAKARYVKRDGSVVEVDVKGGGDFTLPVIVESNEADIVRLELVDIDDPQGLGLDDLVFLFPEPK